jgi:hypothetical protein
LEKKWKKMETMEKMKRKKWKGFLGFVFDCKGVPPPTQGNGRG